MLKRIAHEARQLLDNEEGEEILANIRTLRETFEPEVVAKEDAEHVRRAKAFSQELVEREEPIGHLAGVAQRDLFSAHALVDTTEFFETLDCYVMA